MVAPAGRVMVMEDHANVAAELLALATENAELRLQLAEMQDQCIELAVDGGELHVEITALRVRLAHVEKQRDAWQAEAERYSGRAVA
jgi:regulator of replication initiation timing